MTTSSRTGRFQKSWGPFERAEGTRFVADDKADSVELGDAREMVEKPEALVLAMGTEFMREENAMSMIIGKRHEPSCPDAEHRITLAEMDPFERPVQEFPTPGATEIRAKLPPSSKK